MSAKFDKKKLIKTVESIYEHGNIYRYLRAIRGTLLSKEETLLCNLMICEIEQLWDGEPPADFKPTVDTLFFVDMEPCRY